MFQKSSKFFPGLIVGLALAGSLAAPGLRAAGLESVYSDLDPKRCKNVKEAEDSFEMTCPGVAGFRLLVLEGDLRSSVTVIDPQGKEHPLEFWSVITGGFSTLGPKAEWRVEKQGGKSLPKALIVRVNASENPEKPNVKTSYLAVAKITPQEICVTDKVAPGPKMNEEARMAADSAAARPCRKP
ncbi:MAG: hypothetical protein U1F66_12535 [bacterium]